MSKEVVVVGGGGGGSGGGPRPLHVPRAPSRRSGDGAQAYLSPYLAGVGLGLVLLAAFVFAGRGLGASGAFSAAVATGVSTLAPGHAGSAPAYAGYLESGTSPLRSWLVFEILGVTIGGLLSAVLAGRFRFAVERGTGISNRSRLRYAVAGGAVMGLGAMLARGCTSGQALTGGALLSIGSWLFIVGAFSAGYLAAPLFRKAWR